MIVIIVFVFSIRMDLKNKADLLLDVWLKYSELPGDKITQIWFLSLKHQALPRLATPSVTKIAIAQRTDKGFYSNLVEMFMNN